MGLESERGVGEGLKKGRVKEGEGEERLKKGKKGRETGREVKEGEERGRKRKSCGETEG